MSERRWTKRVLSGIVILLALYMALVFVLDPVMLYHAPWFGLKAQNGTSRYNNYGIARHMEFDSVILGASTFRYAKTSDYNALYDANAARIVFIAGYYREQSDWLRFAFEKKGTLKNVFWALDAQGILMGKDDYHYDGIPTYLYDDNLFNDVNYWFNKDMFPWMLRMVLNHTPLDFDSSDFRDPTGIEAIRAVYQRPETVAEPLPLDEAFVETVTGNVQQNIVEIVEAHPETQFTIVFPPVDMFYWDGVIRRGELDRVLEAERSIFEALAPYENVRVFSFFDDAEIATNFDLYSDTVHFLPEINTEIFEMTVAGEYQLTVENVDARIAAQRAMIEGYDYAALFAQEEEEE